MWFHKIGLTVYLAIFLLGANSVYAETANISDLVFVTEEQTIDTGQISKEITVQTQNSNGEAEKVSETNDLEFKSSSNTGEFLNATGNPVMTTMSRNTSSRTFYYRDSSSGLHTITVKITGRESGTSFSVSQNINIGSTEEFSGATPISSSDSSSNNTSSHSSQSKISTLNIKQELKTDIGRSRIATVNTPVGFEAFVDDVFRSNKTGNNTIYHWSFGDGMSGRGRIISHTYSFPGDYVVVLNARNGDKKSVSKTEVKILEPDVKIVSFEGGEGGFVELKNNSSFEVNLGSFVVSDNIKTFFIAPDTILKPRSSLKLPVSLNGTDKVFLKYPNGKLAVTSDSVESKNINLSDARAVILQDLVNLKKRLEIAKSETINNKHLEISKESLDNGPLDDLEEVSDQSAILLNAYDEADVGFGSKIINLFKSLFTK